MTRIDSHQHFWNYNDEEYVWMTGPLEVLAKDFLPGDLKPHLDVLGFDGTVAVQARQMSKETDFLLDLVEHNRWILGVVGWVDFQAPDFGEQLDRYADNSNFRGIRELIHDMPNLDYAMSEAHARGVGMLGERDLTYDLLLRPPHIKAAITLVDMYPNQRFVVDHIAKPDIKGGMMEPWLGGIRDLALREHVYCKLSGMVTEADWNSWTDAQLVPYIDIVVEAFGPKRLMVGSDWPVSTCAAEYSRAMGVVFDYTKRLTEAERAQILGDTCKSFYGLSVPD